MPLQIPRTRQWGLVGPAQSGKSTFLGSNIKTPALVADADFRFDAVEHLLKGDVIYISRAGLSNPLNLADELEEHGASVNSIVFDAVSVMYSKFSRVASMRGNQFATKEARKAAGLNPNKASDMVAKADVMAVIGNATIYGADVYFVWHRNKGLDVSKMASGEYKDLMQDKDSVSQVELARLATSMNMRLIFSRENGVYSVRVEDARDHASKANVGLVINDYPGNYWKNGADRVVEMVYATFDGQEDALAWAGKKMKVTADSLLDLYNDTKANSGAKTAAQMWLSWVNRVHTEIYRPAQAVAAPILKPVVAQPPAAAQPVQPHARPTAAPPEYAGLTDADRALLDIPSAFEPKAVDGKFVYQDGEGVADADLSHFRTYCTRFGKLPPDEAALHRSVQYAAENNQPY